MSTDPNDRTATLAPRGVAPGLDDGLDDAETLLPVDDPDRYEQIGEHARGGLGRIIRAVDRRLGRTVAVKELLRRDDWHEARFVREALITARLEHPGIVPVHEAGRWPNGDPYYVMKLVEGRTLKELMCTHQSPRERLALLRNVVALADAVGYAHSEGVVHRDVKPSNVIVGSFGETIVVDWGLARDLRETVAEPAAELLAEGSGASTISGKVVGTPAYMAPEQARGETVDARADVYAIGAVLYELLAGKAPHHDQTPRAMLDRVIAGPPVAISSITPTVPPDLADIVGKAMARSPEERYANATLLAEDLRAFQTGKLVSAHTYTAWQLVRKKLGQHRGVVVVALASAVALGAVGVESVRKVVAERDIARGERGRADSARVLAEAKQRELVLLQAETSLRKDPTAALAWLKMYPLSAGDREQVVDVIDEATAAGSARDVFRLGGWVLDAAFTPDGASVVEVARDGGVREFDLATGHSKLIGKSDPNPETLAVSPDGAYAVTGGALGDVTAWPLAGGPEKKLALRGNPVTGLAFDATGTFLIVDRANRAELMDLAGNLTLIGPVNAAHSAVAQRDVSKRAVLVGPNKITTGTSDRVIAQTDRQIEFLSLSPDGALVLLHDGRSVYVVPYAGGALEKLCDFDAQINEIVWTHDLQRAAVIGKRADIPLIEFPSHAMRELRGHTDSVYNGVFTSNGRELLTASDDSTARIWNLDDGSSQALRGHEDDVYRIRLSPDEKLAVTSSLDRSLRVWPLANSDVRVFRESAPIEELELVGNRAFVRTHSSLASWDLDRGTREPVFSWQQGLGQGNPSPDGQHLVTLGANWTLELRGHDNKVIALAGHRAMITHVEWSHDSKTVYSSSVDGTLRRWDVATGKGTLVVEGDAQVSGFAVAADGRIGAQVGDAAMMIWPDGRAKTIGTGEAYKTMAASFDRVKDRLLMVRSNHTFAILDGEVLTNLETEGAAVESIAVSRDGSKIAAGLTDRTVRIWDARGALLQVLRGHSDLVLDLAFSPDDTTLATASYDRTVRIWTLGTNRHRVMRGHDAPVSKILWRDPTHLLTTSADGTLRSWLVPTTEPPSQAEVSKRLDRATTATIDAQNRATTVGG